MSGRRSAWQPRWSYVSVLRRGLRPASPIATETCGCRLHAERVVVDVDRSDALLREVAVAVARERRAGGAQRRP